MRMNTSLLQPKFLLKEGIHGVGVFTVVEFKKGDTLFELSGPIIYRPTRTSIQIGKNKHIEDDIGIYINHSCFPTAKVNRKKLTFICLRDIGVGEEITFDYNKNEDILAAPFLCHCCHKKIVGKKASKMNMF